MKEHERAMCDRSVCVCERVVCESAVCDKERWCVCVTMLCVGICVGACVLES